MSCSCKGLENAISALKEHACPSGPPSSLPVLGECERPDLSGSGIFQIIALTRNALAGQQLCIISGGQGTYHGPGRLWSSALHARTKFCASTVRVTALGHVRVSTGCSLNTNVASPLPSFQRLLLFCRQSSWQASVSLLEQPS